jgi:hypothetical protein
MTNYQEAMRQFFETAPPGPPVLSSYIPGGILARLAGLDANSGYPNCSETIRRVLGELALGLWMPSRLPCTPSCPRWRGPNRWVSWR